MNETSANVSHLVVEAASNPKVATGVAAGCISTGYAAQLDLITGMVAMLSVWIGALTGAIVMTIQIFKLLRTLREWREEKPLPKDE